LIRAREIGKRFRTGAGFNTRGIHEALERVARSAARRRLPPEDEGFRWALRNISFDVHRGDVIGVLGRNGAGKSVLLRILSRVTAPTEGSAEIFGHVAPLLEIGAGFHPELSGRQNVYFNGAILGMDRDQICRKFDEIVAFAEVGAVIDTPVKLYSSGMRMRLAFSVAVHLDSEVLVIDEALAVGDAEFRAKCSRKIREFISRGCTLMLVSHDNTILRDLCNRAILLENGTIAADGDIVSVLDRYTQRLEPANQ
jgi:lipopolysaccharide transport system ATP-binding protein